MKSKNLLITLGCSWTHGVGVNYQPGMSYDDYCNQAWKRDLCNTLSFRGRLVESLNLHRINFSEPGSSNQRQFRLARTFFSSRDFLRLKNKYKNITVLWGITSTARNELYDLDTKKLESFFLTNNENPIAKSLLKYSYDHENETQLLSIDMKFWNVFFENIGVTNYWFDTFNHHNYENLNYSNIHRSFDEYYQINDLETQYKKLAENNWPSWDNFMKGDLKGVPLSIVKKIYRTDNFGKFLRKNHPSDLKINRLIEQSYPRDLASYLAIKHGWVPKKDSYHHSGWEVDCDRIEYLTKIGLLNPWSNHPTAWCHEELAEFFKPYIVI